MNKTLTYTHLVLSVSDLKTMLKGAERQPDCKNDSRVMFNLTTIGAKANLVGWSANQTTIDATIQEDVRALQAPKQ